MAAKPPPAPPDGVPPQRFQFATTDPDEAQDFIEQMWSARPPRAGRQLDRISPVAISQVSAGGMSYVDFTMPPDLTLHLAGTDDLSVTTLITGGTHAELGKDTERYTAGDVCLGSFPRGDYLVRCLQFRAGILTVPAAALAKAAGSLPGQPYPALRFDSLRPASPAAAGQWQRAAAFVTTRAIQLAFRHHTDITPLGYLRQVRLNHAHHDLLAADPDHETVTAVAYRWGFPSTSRFAAYYRQAYGVPPRHTLHQD